ncbi:MAG: Hsp20/alpha crystallin family protein [Verrucomicrobiota bacterium]
MNKVAALQLVRRTEMASGRKAAAEGSWTPNTDVYLTNRGLVIKVELAGMKREDLELTVEGNQLRISGVRRDCSRGGECKFVLMEINYGRFESLIELPPGYDLGNAKASYQNGFLQVDVPALATPASQPFSVPIDVEDE